MDNLEKQQLKEFLTSVYGASAQTWPMNEDIFDLTFKLLQESGKCSDVMDLVPRPLGPMQLPQGGIILCKKSGTKRSVYDLIPHHSSTFTAYDPT